MKKLILTFILSDVGLCVSSAEVPIQGIIVTYEGSETSYKLSDIPTSLSATARYIYNGGKLIIIGNDGKMYNAAGILTQK